MNQYKKRSKKYCYQPGSKEPFRISRFRAERFLKCPRCFYLDRRLGLDRPGMPGWPLNAAVDHLLKNEFDLLRKNGEKHALMEEYGVEAVPFDHPDLPEWRDDNYNYKGICALHEPTNLELCGIIDDVWVKTAHSEAPPEKSQPSLLEEDKSTSNSNGELFIVDYKSTSTSKKISLDDKYKQAYKKQIEWYQWLFRQNGFNVSDTAYFVYANGLKGERVFDAKIEFAVQIIDYQGDDSWVEPTIFKMKECLEKEEIPKADPSCEFCKYRKLIKKADF